MNREFYLPIILGIMMLASSFSIYQYATAQINDSYISAGNATIIQPLNMTSNVNYTQNEDGLINNANNWTIISGAWAMQGNIIHGGSSDNTTTSRSNIILNPIVPENASKISTAFKINSINNTVANYAQIVYSFVDPENYKLVGINILKDSIYAVGYTVRDGDLNVAEPFWPGIRTNLTYTPGSTYNITLANQGSSLELLVNGTSYLKESLNSQIKFGQIGLDYGRAQDIDFLAFKTGIGVQ